MGAGLAGVLSCLEKETGRSFEPVDFPRRLRIQKSVYLLKQLGYRPVSSYPFNLYVSGPYAPALARDYYDLMEKNLERVRPARIPGRHLEIVKDAVGRGLPFLETVCTLHVIAHANPERDREDVFLHFERVKPSLRTKMEGAWEFLEDNRLLPGPT